MGRQPSAAYNPHGCREVPGRLYCQSIIAALYSALVRRLPSPLLRRARPRLAGMLAFIEALRQRPTKLFDRPVAAEHGAQDFCQAGEIGVEGNVAPSEPGP